MLDYFTPYLLVIKLVLIAALMGAASYGGYRVGVDRTTQKWDADKVIFAQKETAWETEKAASNAAAAITLARVVAQAQAAQAAMQQKADAAQARYIDAAAKLKAAQEAAKKVAEGKAPEDGLWINTVSCLKASSDGITRCRIANADADNLIGIASLADERTNLLNQCIARVNITPPSTSDTPSSAQAPPDYEVDYSLSHPAPKPKLGTSP